MTNNNYSSVIAIDGPSGSGKSTIAKKVAHKLGILYIDTGAMYRSLAYYLKNAGLIIDNPDQEQIARIEKKLSSLDFEYGASEDELVVLDGQDLTLTIREHYVSKLASQVSKIQVVRDYLKEKQRAIASDKHSVMEGRDIGTVVFPNAYCKIFLTASSEVRAQRRLEQLQEKGDHSQTYETILKDIKDRDESDTTRSNAPLKMADDANEVDTSSLTLEQVQDKIIEISNKLKNRL